MIIVMKAGLLEKWFGWRLLREYRFEDFETKDMHNVSAARFPDYVYAAFCAGY